MTQQQPSSTTSTSASRKRARSCLVSVLWLSAVASAVALVHGFHVPPPPSRVLPPTSTATTTTTGRRTTFPPFYHNRNSSKFSALGRTRLSQSSLASSSSTERRDVSSTSTSSTGTVVVDSVSLLQSDLMESTSSSTSSSLPVSTTTPVIQEQQSEWKLSSSLWWTQMQELTGGAMDPERFLYPDYATGRVSRLWTSSTSTSTTSPAATTSSSSSDGSWVEEEEDETNVTSVSTSAPASWIQATLCVTATILACGAPGGWSTMLGSNPVTEAGLFPATFAMLASWMYMNIAGLLMAELTLNQMGRMRDKNAVQAVLDLFPVPNNNNDNDDSLKSSWSAVAARASYVGWHTFMLAACVAGLDTVLFGSEAPLVPFLTGLAPLALPVSVLAMMAAATTTMSNRNRSNSISSNMLSLAALPTTVTALVAAGIATANIPSITASAEATAAITHDDWLTPLLDASHQHPELTVHFFPVFCLAFGFPTAVPHIVKLLQGDRQQIRTAIVAGSSLPLLLWGLWNVVTSVAVVNPTIVTSLTVITLGAALVRYSQGLVEGWQSILRDTSTTTTDVDGVVTTIPRVNGVLLAHRDEDDSNHPIAKQDVKKMANTLLQENPWLVSVAALLPVLALVASAGDDHNNYAVWSGYAGAFGVSTLCLLLTPLAVWRERYGDAVVPLTVKPLVPAGKLPLGSMYKAAATLIVEQGAEQLGLFDLVHDYWVSFMS